MSNDLCGDRLSYCECAVASGHDGPHLCYCRGSWTEEREIVSFPEGLDLSGAIAKFWLSLDPLRFEDPE